MKRFSLAFSSSMVRCDELPAPGFDPARPRTKDLLAAVRDVLSVEEGWAVVQEFLDLESDEAYTRGQEAVLGRPQVGYEHDYANLRDLAARR